MDTRRLYQNVKQVTFLAMNITGLYQNVKQVTISGYRHNRAISERQAVDSLWLWGYACTRCSKQVIVCRKMTVTGNSSRYTSIPLTWTPRLCCMMTILIRVRQHLLLWTFLAWPPRISCVIECHGSFRWHHDYFPCVLVIFNRWAIIPSCFFHIYTSTSPNGTNSCLFTMSMSERQAGNPFWLWTQEGYIRMSSR